MTHLMTDARASYRAGLTLTDEAVAVDSDADGLALTSDVLFVDGWLCLGWADVAALVMALTTALDRHMEDVPSARPGCPGSRVRPSGRSSGLAGLNQPENAPGEGEL